jgi:hypothetical protein
MRPEPVPARVRLKRKRGNSSNLESLRSHNPCITNGHLEDGVLEAAVARKSVSPSVRQSVSPSVRQSVSPVPSGSCCSFRMVPVPRRDAPDRNEEAHEQQRMPELGCSCNAGLEVLEEGRCI